MMDEGVGVTEEGERLSVTEEGRGGGSELGLDLDPDPWKILWIRIWQNDANPLDPDQDPQHYCKGRVGHGKGQRRHQPESLSIYNELYIFALTPLLKLIINVQCYLT